LTFLGDVVHLDKPVGLTVTDDAGFELALADAVLYYSSGSFQLDSDLLRGGPAVELGG